jgi:hypothetical protein
VYGLQLSEIGLVRSDNAPTTADTATIGGRLCAVAGLLGLDVADDYAFDIDEPVELALTYAPERTTAPSIRIAWDQNAGEGRGSAAIEPQTGAPLRTARLTLDRARLAGQGIRAIDIAVGNNRGEVALCGVVLTRSNLTPERPAAGRLLLEVVDVSTGRSVPARVGLYDSADRLPLPSTDAVGVQRFADHVRRLWASPRDHWPSENRDVFYVDGTYGADVPAGEYTLVVSRGPEYRTHIGTVTVPQRGTAAVRVPLERYVDLPSRGWISGDAHIHLPRDSASDAAAWTQLAAEDVHVASLLQMGNIAGVHFPQPDWGSTGGYSADGYVLVSGQEDPRTGHRGHTMHLNLTEPIRPEASEYFLYDRTFAASREQGAASGYAHLAPWFSPSRGLALDVPSGNVDFLEVLQYGRLNTEIWYDFLNLGYRLVPAAGSDFPYLDLPGAVRQYVQVADAAGPEAWFDAFRAGRTYVTSGPFLELDVGGRTMGDELVAEPGTTIPVVAEARLNPDIAELDRIELVMHGDVLATQRAEGGDRVTLRTEIEAQASAWLAVRAYGRPANPRAMIVAHSTPVYLIVDGEPTWKASAVPELVQRYRTALREMMDTPIDPEEDLETFETRELLLREWARQRELLRDGVREADSLLADLVTRLTSH